MADQAEWVTQSTAPYQVTLMPDSVVRLQCLELAASLALAGDDILDQARKFSDFVLGIEPKAT